MDYEVRKREYLVRKSMIVTVRVKGLISTTEEAEALKILNIQYADVYKDVKLNKSVK